MNNEELEKNGYVLINRFFKDIQPWYWINNSGKIYSTISNSFLNPYVDKDGYLRQSMRLIKPTENGNYNKLCGIHMLVNTVFNGYPPVIINNPVTDHIDGNKTNNYYRNLRWLSNELNASYVNRHKGQKSEIEEYDVVRIFDMYKNGKTLQEIADHYHTGWKYIHGILTGKKRAIAIEKFRLTPIESTRSAFTTKDIKEIVYDLIKENKSGYSIAKERNIPYPTIGNIMQKHRHADKTQYYDFKNKQILYDPDNFINSYDEFIQMDDYYNQFVYETENNEEFDMFTDNSNEVVIGYTEYYTDDTWND